MILFTRLPRSGLLGKYGYLTIKKWPPGIYTNLQKPVIVRSINQTGLAQITPLLRKSVRLFFYRQFPTVSENPVHRKPHVREGYF
jgi:hypothetical protein